MRTMKTLILFIILCSVSYGAHAQIVAPTGITTRASSQLIYYYDTTVLETEPAETTSTSTDIQVTNSNDTQGVWIHVKIFRSFNLGEPEDPNLVICEERDFVDFLTPNDTHVYDLSEPFFAKNIGETEVNVGESTTLDLRDTKGFIVITPVVSQADLSAISFQHLAGASIDDSRNFIINAMGRDAVDFTTGQIVADGTPLDGVTNGYVLLQPEELVFNFENVESSNPEFGPRENNVDIVGIAFRDVYGEPGLLGYGVTPANATWTTFIFDYKEAPTSCGNRAVNCFSTTGLNDTIGHSNFTFNGNDLLCPGSVSPPQPGIVDLNTSDDISTGWTRIFVSGLDDFVNHVGVYYSEYQSGADFMYVKGERTDPTPPPTCQFIDGSPNCDDPLCAQEEVAEGLTCEEFNEDPAGFCGVEVPCEDPNCVGVEPNCPLPPTPTPTPAPGTGGGCSVAAGVTTAAAAANFLLPLLPLAGAFALRRMRRRNR